MRRWLINTFHLGRKEIASLASDTVLAIFIVYSFSFSVYSIATGIKTEVHNALIAVVDSDHSVLSARLRDALLTPQFRPARLVDRADVDSLMDRSAVTFVIDIPPRLEPDVLRGRAPAMQLNIDATAMTQAGVGGSYIDGIMQQEATSYLNSAGIEAQLPVAAVPRAFFNPNLEGMWFHAIDAVLENITMLSILLAGAAVIRERERGTIEHLLVMPVRAGEIAAAKIWANGLVILVATGLSLTLVVGKLLAVPIAGSLPLFLAGTALYLFATTSLGILLATIARTMPQFALLAIPAFMILNMLSGAISPLEAMPPLLQTVLQASPTMHYMAFAQSVLFRAAGIEVVWPHAAAFGAIGMLFLAVALARFRSMLAQVQ
jgi:ABC-2 type transport system permease protein